MPLLGYARLVEMLGLQVLSVRQPAQISASVNRRIDTASALLFPSGVAVEDTVIGQLEFALRHEGVNLELIDALYEKIEANELIQALMRTPNSAPLRRAAFLWEWLTGDALEGTLDVAAGYVDLFPADQYVTSTLPQNVSKFRVRNNALGDARFCPIVRRAALPEATTFAALMAEVGDTLQALTDPALYQRAIDFMYLSETRSSFQIEREEPSSDKQERFVQLLRRAGEHVDVDEDWLVGLQNTVVRNAFSQDASYRTKQNWLEDGTGRITFFPAPADELRSVMAGLEQFINTPDRCPDILVKAACAAFGFVYIHPFMDGNGRLHRFLIHHVLAQAGALPQGTVLPVSAVILKNLPEYVQVLSGFSAPVTRLWHYMRGDPAPIITQHPGARAYRFFDASREVAFLYRMVEVAVREELPRELAWLSGYDQAFHKLDMEFDLPMQDLSALIRMVKSNNGTLSKNRRKQYYHLPDAVLDRIEQVVGESFDFSGAISTHKDN